MKCELYNDSEEWRDIPGYEGLYQASSFGEIRSVDREQKVIWKGKTITKQVKGKHLKQRDHNSGYLVVWLSKFGKVKPFTVHRIIAKVFLNNGNSADEVNHLDGNKKNNRVENLEWCSRSENINHMYSALQKGRGGKRIVCVETNQTFASITEAAQAVNRTDGAIHHALKNSNRKAGGYHWKWA